MCKRSTASYCTPTGCTVDTIIISKVTGYKSGWLPNRPFAIDMAGFAISLDLILEKTDANFSYQMAKGMQESEFLSYFTTKEELEPLADQCTKVYVWHTRTETPKINALDGSVGDSDRFDRTDLIAVGDLAVLQPCKLEIEVVLEGGILFFSQAHTVTLMCDVNSTTMSLSELGLGNIVLRCAIELLPVSELTITKLRYCAGTLGSRTMSFA
ncbi:hypothetical protein D910_03096 [Dendroctonus ponderosae]|uniref:Galactosylgalactosylxylosylprotein 3-beta-glucuronosyltransferase n=1 Tax=Dendroctonus ponderosae TaxID=77166 RepID=U4U6U9_DENPD|nr:hypothetical protein D910_03096 [Dendroctonus ponderosae]